eukprot:jgi/Mesvir1/1084/Mv17597-RA.1
MSSKMAKEVFMTSTATSLNEGRVVLPMRRHVLTLADNAGAEESTEDLMFWKHKYFKTALWALAAWKLFKGPCGRLAEVTAFQTDAVLPSDVLMGLLAWKTCPIEKLPFISDDVVGKLALLAATVATGAGLAAARRRRKSSIATQATAIAPGTYRSVRAPGGQLATTYREGVSTLYDSFFEFAVAHHGDQRCLGTRAGNKYLWDTYRTAGQRASAFAAGLCSLGAQPGDKIGIYSVNSAEWVLTELGCYTQSLIPISLYDTLGDNAVEFVINHAEVATVVVSRKNLPTLLSCLPRCPRVKLVILMGAGDIPAQQAADARSAGVTLRTFGEVEATGLVNPVAPRPPAPTDLATIMYTSGTTGDPKGVMLTHANILASGTTYPLVLETKSQSLGYSDRYLSYLPLAHIMERCVLAVMMVRGVAIGFYSGKPELLLEDMKVLKPTIMVAVPRIYNRIYDKVMEKVNKSKVKSLLFKAALAEKTRLLSAGGEEHVPLWDALVFKPVRGALGGHARLLVSGGAPLGDSVQQFLRCAFAAPVIQGYGLTESAAAGTIQLLDDKSNANVGAPVPCTDIKLESVAEMGYTVDDAPCPRGELLLRGPNVTAGYYKEEDKTREAIDKDGWFHTGDIASVAPSGIVTIIDR